MTGPKTTSTIAAIIVTMLTASTLALGTYLSHPERKNGTPQPVGVLTVVVAVQEATPQRMTPAGRLAEMPQVTPEVVNDTQATFFGIPID